MRSMVPEAKFIRHHKKINQAPNGKNCLSPCHDDFRVAVAFLCFVLDTMENGCSDNGPAAAAAAAAAATRAARSKHDCRFSKTSCSPSIFRTYIRSLST